MHWQVNPELEHALRVYAERLREGWMAVTQYLIDSFAAFVGQDVETVWEPHYEDVRPRCALACGIRSSSPLGGPLQLEWYAVLSYGNGRPVPYALVLLFARDARLIRLPRAEYLAFDYVRDDTGRPGWVCRGWETSEMGDEFDGYEWLSTVCREFRGGQP